MRPVRSQRNSQKGEDLVLCIYPIITQGQGRKFMSFVISFLIPQRTSQTQRIFLLTISKDSLRTLSRIYLDISASNQRYPQVFLVSQYTKYPQISYISVFIHRNVVELQSFSQVFGNGLKNIRCPINLVGVCGSQRTVHEMSRRYVTVYKVSSEY